MFLNNAVLDVKLVFFKLTNLVDNFFSKPHFTSIIYLYSIEQ